MSNIYINEPPTSGKVLLRTTAGDIDIELWSKEAPRACRNFIQLCLEGYYNNTIFHRVVKGFIVQGGDPTGSGLGGESIYGKPFRDEFHQRLRFVRRGLVGMANAGKDDNGSQFFFTLGPCPDLQNKHTIFGKIAGNTLYNMLKLEESQTDRNEKPLYPHKIIGADILCNPFPDIVPRVTPTKSEKKQQKKEEPKGKKDFKLLSFGDEAEEEEEEINGVINEFRGKSKSSHDLLTNDPKLSSIPAVDPTEIKTKKKKKKRKDDEEEDEDEDEEEEEEEEEDSDKERRKKERLERIKKKLERSDNNKAKATVFGTVPEDMNLDFMSEGISEKLRREKEKLEGVRKEFNQLKKQIATERRKKVDAPEVYREHENPAVEEFRKQAAKYKEVSKSLAKRGSSRQEQTFQMLEKFRQRLESQKLLKAEREEEEEKVGPLGEKDQSWLAHQLKCQKEETVLAKDANMRGEGEWYDLYDPRNPINIRRREGVLLPEEMMESKKKKV